MSIKFLCPHCKKVVSVKDEFAGKKGKCPHCTKLLTVPAPSRPNPPAAPPAPKPAPKLEPAAPPPPAPMDIEAEAAAALGDEPKPEADAPPPATIDFNCPMCDEELHLPLDLAGKREPCPKCRRIIKVPEPAKRDPANWRQGGPSLPSGAKRAEEKAPEGAWGSATGAATVSRESLQDAGAVAVAKAPLTLQQRIIRIAAPTGIAILFLVGGLLGYFKWMNHREQVAVEAALEYAESDQGKTDLGRDGRAAIYLLAGQQLLQTGQTDCAKEARKWFRKCLVLLRDADAGGSATEHDALLQDLAASEVELGGSTATDMDAGMKLPWDEVQKELHPALSEIRYSDARIEALRAVARRLAVKGEGARATALAPSLNFSSNRDKADTNREKAEALGAVGLELLAAGKTDLAGKSASQALSIYNVKENRPALTPAAVALAVALGGDWKPPEPVKKPTKGWADDARYDLLGRAEGLARAHQWEQAREAARDGRLQGDEPLRAFVSLAAAALDDKSAGKADAEEAVQRAAGVPSPWVLLRLSRIGERAGVAADALQNVATTIPDRDLRGRAQLAALKAQFAQSKQTVDLKALETVEAQSLSARLARTEWARRNTGSMGVVKGWDPPNKAFGLLGIVLGPQGDE